MNLKKLGLESDTNETINPAAITAGACNTNYTEKFVGDGLSQGLWGLKRDGRRHHIPSYTPTALDSEFI